MNETPEPLYDLDAERSVLGGMLLSHDAIVDVSEVLTGADFYKPAHELIFNTAVELFGRGEPADAVAVNAALTARGEVQRVGGGAYLHALMGAVPVAANAGYYAQIVRERATLRRLSQAGVRIQQMAAQSDGADLAQILDRAQEELFAVAAPAHDGQFLTAGQVAEGALVEAEAIGEAGGKPLGVPTGFADLDELTGGLHPGQMVIIAARPALGKSTLGLDLLRSCSIRHGLTGALFSLEMGRNEIGMRMLSAEARVGLHRMRTGGMTPDDWTRLAGCMGEVTGAPLLVDDEENATVAEIHAKCRRLQRQHDLRLVVVDYLQLLGGSGRRTENRQQEVSAMSRALKLMAKALQVPVVAICQLNRGPEQRADKRPLMSDLRESGSLEQDADVVILLHREDAYEPESPRAGEADLIVAKHRNGPTATITVAFQGHFSRFVDMARS